MHVAEKDIKIKMFRVYKMAEQSSDLSTKNGALICEDGWNIVAGCNHHVEGFVDIPGCHERPLKYEITEHAERDAIFRAVRKGYDVRGLTLVANWAACPDCARAIVLCGIGDVICHKQCMDRTPERWKERVNLGLRILERGGVNVYQWDGEVGGIDALMDGKVWRP
jgi:dCMP deaminase